MSAESPNSVTIVLATRAVSLKEGSVQAVQNDRNLLAMLGGQYPIQQRCFASSKIA